MVWSFFKKKPRIPSALDVSNRTFNDYEKEMVRNIKKHGFFITYVSPNGKKDEGDFQKSFCYTTGLWRNLQFPELITFGLPYNNCHGLYWQIYRKIKSGKSFDYNSPLSSIADSFDVILSPTPKSANSEYLLSAKWFYGNDDFPCLQMIWPDDKGNFPWQDNFNAKFADDQINLSPEVWR